MAASILARWSSMLRGISDEREEQHTNQAHLKSIFAQDLGAQQPHAPGINELATEISALAERLAASLLAIRRKASSDSGREALRAACSASGSRISGLWRLEEVLVPVLSTPLA